VGYAKPGADLAKLVADSIAESPGTRIVLMRNHGVVIAGNSVEQIDHDLHELCSVFSCSFRSGVRVSLPHSRSFSKNGVSYSLVDDPRIQQLAFDESILVRLPVDWALYPDHVVFLGPRPYIFDSLKEFSEGAVIDFCPS